MVRNFLKFANWSYVSYFKLTSHFMKFEKKNKIGQKS